MYYYFNNEITTESVNELVEKLSQEEGQINRSAARGTMTVLLRNQTRVHQFCFLKMND